MSVAHAVMGVLAGGERYGYELRRGLEDELGPEWRLDFGQLYRALGTMAAKGWVAFRVEPGQGGPARKVYTLTAAGRRELERWLRHAPRTLARRRDHAARAHASGSTVLAAGTDLEDPPLLAVGSDDLVLDLLARRLAQEHPEIRFAARAGRQSLRADRVARAPRAPRRHPPARRRLGRVQRAVRQAPAARGARRPRQPGAPRARADARRREPETAFAACAI